MRCARPPYLESERGSRGWAACLPCSMWRRAGQLRLAGHESEWRDRVRHRREEAVSVCQEALAYLSEWERNEHEKEIHELERLAPNSLAARVDLQMAQSDYVPHAPVLACETLSDLTRYLCTLGRAEEARREVEALTARYPRGSFRDYEFHDHRFGRRIKVSVTKREQATLRRIERALGSQGRRRLVQNRRKFLG